VRGDGVRPGSSEAFRAVFEAQADRLVRLAWLVSGDRDLAEDATAEAFARVYDQWRRGRVSNVEAYLRQAVVRQVHNRWRRLGLQRRESARRSGDHRGERAMDEDVVDRDAVRRGLAGLSDRQRTAVVLRFYGGLSEAETAAAMGCSSGSVKTHLHRGLARLRARLPEATVGGVGGGES